MNTIHFTDRNDDLLLLDLDGTVIDIAARPDAVIVEAILKTALRDLHYHDPHGLVIVTGRALSDVDRLLDPLRLPAIASHGAELRLAGTAGGVAALPVKYLQPLIEGIMRPFLPLGAVLEWKPFSAAVHVRAAHELTNPIADALTEFVQRHRAYRLQRGRHVFEVLPAGISKAQSVRRLLQHLPYAGRRSIYIGDDSADEDAMKESARLGGIALRVAGEFFTQPASYFSSPSEVRAWLVSKATDRTSGTSRQSSRCISE